MMVHSDKDLEKDWRVIAQNGQARMSAMCLRLDSWLYRLRIHLDSETYRGILDCQVACVGDRYRYAAMNSVLPSPYQSL